MTKVCRRLPPYPYPLKFPSFWLQRGSLCLDTVPFEVDTQLRINRTDSILPDSHGQIWKQFTATYRNDPDMFDENSHSKAETEQYVMRMLQLGGESRALVNRMITLWRKDAWRSTLNKWNATDIGYATFNIGTFHWMSALRLDEVRVRAG